MRRCLLIVACLVGAAHAQTPLKVAPPETPIAAERPDLPPLPTPEGPDAQRFAEAEAALKAFEALSFDLPRDRGMGAWGQAMGELMPRQAKAMSDLQQRYGQIASSAAPEYAVPAMVRMGEVFEAFAARLETLPLPHDLPPEAHKPIYQGLKQSAETLRTAALTNYRQAVGKADAHGVTGPWVDFARQALAAAAKPGLALPAP